MKRNFLLSFVVLAVVVALQTTGFSTGINDTKDEDSDTRIIDAQVVEVTDSRISVMARTGVEHVIAINRKNTKVTIDGADVLFKDVKEGDIVTIELDVASPMKLAKDIRVVASGSEVARINR